MSYISQILEVESKLADAIENDAPVHERKMLEDELAQLKEKQDSE